MNKIWLITKREYGTRVRNNTFLLSTFLLPLMIVIFIAGSVLLAMQGKSHHRIGVLDENNYFKNYLKGDSTLSFDFSPGLDTANYEKQGCTALLIIPRITTLPIDNNLPAGNIAAAHNAPSAAAVTPQAATPNPICRLIYKKQLGFTGEEDLKGRIRGAIT